MKLVTISLLLSLAFKANAFAQSVTSPPAPPAFEEAQTVVGGPGESGLRFSGWFVAPTFATTGFGGTLAYSPGIRGGIYLGQRIGIGLVANGLGRDDSSISEHEARNFGTYGGLLLQYVLQSNRLVHATFESTIGSGRWCPRIDDETQENDGCTGRNFLVFEPVANVELNVAKHVRFTTGVGYRFAVAGNGEGPSSRDMSSLVVRSGLVFGSF